ncbi:DUF5955 family protein [Nocardia barduliensis]|uniref:DUF5955 family protein n=1 Tax=Nocardia barduliensis TaxID=2736643 RepID=UPI001574126A|nr:DUF5955 family protein [Nocardia barduliensis]
MNKNVGSNTGVSIGGSANLTGSVVAGRDGTVSNTAGAAAIPVPQTVAELRSALHDLLDRISRYDAELPDRQLVEETTRQAVAEAAKERPNRLVLSGFLHAVGRSVAGIASLAAVVSALEIAVKVVLG